LVTAKNGDYQERSWHSFQIRIYTKHKIWKKVEALGGAGLLESNFSWLMMVFIFFQLSPRPHDTGMVTGTQNFNEFELHLRAILSLPILKSHWKSRTSAVILASENV
jgi:phosphoribosylglycinamide formyltransferase 2